jgi:hypothetical protein
MHQQRKATGGRRNPLACAVHGNACTLATSCFPDRFDLLLIWEATCSAGRSSLPTVLCSHRRKRLDRAGVRCLPSAQRRTRHAGIAVAPGRVRPSERRSQPFRHRRRCDVVSLRSDSPVFRHTPTRTISTRLPPSPHPRMPSRHCIRALPMVSVGSHVQTNAAHGVKEPRVFPRFPAYQRTRRQGDHRPRTAAGHHRVLCSSAASRGVARCDPLAWYGPKEWRDARLETSSADR